jgi:prepilin-type N-terminal cleavage/methylation domain-containing protein
VEPAVHKARSRRGLTFIETVCAVALLGIVAATVFGAFNSVLGAQKRQQHRLNAMEVANRLILQYLDDKDTLPQAGLPVEYAEYKYRWDLREIPVRLEPARPEVAEERSSSTPVSVDRMQAVSVRVWLSDESGGSLQYDEVIPAVTLTRLMDPIAMRNPDTIKLYRDNPKKQSEMLDRFRRVGRNAPGGRPAPSPAPSAPQQPAPKGKTGGKP